jgi:hypothetical protein
MILLLFSANASFETGTDIMVVANTTIANIVNEVVVIFTFSKLLFKVKCMYKTIQVQTTKHVLYHDGFSIVIGVNSSRCSRRMC